MPPRTLVIGDIHGCLRQFDALLDTVAVTASDRLILLGDLVDRGPDSAGVVRRAIGLSARCRLSVIRGNHEQMMIDARKSHAEFSDWLQNGGDDTLKSYGGMRGALRDVPDEHWYFLSTGLVNYVEDDTHIFVHANAYPDVSMDDQPDYMLRWERCDRIAAHESGKVLVCGHTPQKDGRVMNLEYAVCLDTNAGRGGPLTCLETGGGRMWQAAPDGRVTRGHLSDF